MIRAILTGGLDASGARVIERPTCLDCISQKAGVSTIEADGYLTVIGTTLKLRRTDDRCHACGEHKPVYSLMRSSN
jgi:hypothetical protein